MPVDLTAPIAVLGLELVTGDLIGVAGVTAYGRPLYCVVPWWRSTIDGIDAALRDAWRQQIERDEDRAGALASYQAEREEPYAVADDSDGV